MTGIKIIELDFLCSSKMLADCWIKVQCHLAAQTVEEDHFLQTFFSSGWQVEDKWKVKMARGGMLVSRNGYRGTLPCRALWDMSSTEVAAQMTYYSSAGNAWAYRRRRFSCVLQTFHFGCLPCCFYPGSARAPRRAEACLRWPLQRRMRARRTV